MLGDRGGLREGFANEIRTGPAEIKEPRGSAQMWQDAEQETGGTTTHGRNVTGFISHCLHSRTRVRRRSRGEGSNGISAPQGLSQRRQRGCGPRRS
jgi:hypothetical protein